MDSYAKQLQLQSSQLRKTHGNFTTENNKFLFEPNSKFDELIDVRYIEKVVQSISHYQFENLLRYIDAHIRNYHNAHDGDEDEKMLITIILILNYLT